MYVKLYLKEINVTAHQIKNHNDREHPTYQEELYLKHVDSSSENDTLL